MGFTNSSIEIEKDLVRFRQTASLILNSIIKGVDTNRRVASKTQDAVADIQRFREKYPFYVQINAPKEHLTFADKLKKEEYTQIEAANLLGISRQTLGKYVKESIHGFKFNPKNKKVTGEQLYNYYIKNIYPKKS